VFGPLFSPKYDTPGKKLSAKAMTPQQIRDALPERCPIIRTCRRCEAAVARNPATP